MPVSVTSVLNAQPFASSDMEQLFQKESEDHWAWACTYQALVSVLEPVVVLVYCWQQQYPITPPLMGLLSVMWAIGIPLTWVGHGVPNVRPHLRVVNAVYNILITGHTAVLMYVLSTFAETVHPLVPVYQNEVLATVFGAQVTVLGFAHIIGGFNRLACLAVLSSTVLFLVFTLATAAASYMWWYAFLLFAVLCCLLLLSIHVAVLRRSAFEARHPAGALYAQRAQDSAAVSCLVRESLTEVQRELLVLMEGNAPPYPRGSFAGALGSLQRCIRWCNNHQAYLQLVASRGKISPSRQKVRLNRLGTAVVAGRKVAGSFSHRTVCLDRVVCEIMLDTALENAKKHGHPDDPRVMCSIAVGDTSRASVSATVAAPDSVTERVVFTVSNVVDPAKPDLPENVALKVLQDPQRSSLLKHSMLAATALGMKADIVQDGDVVTFQAQGDVEVGHDDDDDEEDGGATTPVHAGNASASPEERRPRRTTSSLSTVIPRSAPDERQARSMSEDEAAVWARLTALEMTALRREEGRVRQEIERAHGGAWDAVRARAQAAAALAEARVRATGAPPNECPDKAGEAGAVSVGGLATVEDVGDGVPLAEPSRDPVRTDLTAGAVTTEVLDVIESGCTPQRQRQRGHPVCRGQRPVPDCGARLGPPDHAWPPSRPHQAGPGRRQHRGDPSPAPSTADTDAAAAAATLALMCAMGGVLSDAGLPGRGPAAGPAAAAETAAPRHAERAAGRRWRASVRFADPPAPAGAQPHPSHGLVQTPPALTSSEGPAGGHVRATSRLPESAPSPPPELQTLHCPSLEAAHVKPLNHVSGPQGRVARAFDAWLQDPEASDR